MPAYVDETLPDTVCGYHLAVVTPHPRTLDGGYLAWLAKSPVLNDQFKLAAKGVTRFGLSQHSLKNARVKIPGLDCQRKVAAFLDKKTAEIDTLIAKKRKLLVLLAEKRVALITRAVTKGLNPDAPMKDSGIEWLGEVPVNWEVTRAKHIAVLESGHTPSKSNPEFWTDCNIPWVSLRDTKSMASHDFINETHTYISQKGLEGSSARLLPAGSVVFTRDATVGLTAITEREMAVSQHLIAWIPGKQVTAKYLLFCFGAMKGYLDSLSFGSTVKTIGMDDIRKLIAPLPPIEEQEEITDYVIKYRYELKKMESKINSAIERLQEYRAALITNAVTGQIKVA